MAKTGYVLSVIRWRVALAAEPPNLSPESVLGTVQKAIKMTNVPVNATVQEVTSNGVTEKRVVLEHSNDRYSLFPTTVALASFGNFVYATQENWLVSPPVEPHDYNLALESNSNSVQALTWGILLAIAGLALGFLVDPVMLWGVVIGGALAYFGNAGLATINARNRENATRKLNHLEAVIGYLNKAYPVIRPGADEQQLFMLLDSLSVVVTSALSTMFSESAVNPPEKKVFVDDIRAQVAKVAESVDKKPTVMYDAARILGHNLDEWIRQRVKW